MAATTPQPLRAMSIARKLMASNVLARSQRVPPQSINRTMTIAVAALDERILSSPVSTSVALLLHAVSQQPVVAIDVDAINQPLRGQLGAGSGGDLEGLAAAEAGALTRATIETFADISGAVPLVSNPPTGRHKIAPDILDTVISRATHRWPTVVIDLPFTCDHHTIAAGTAVAKHVLLVTDGHHKRHDWLYQPGHQLTDAAREGRVTMIRLGGSLSDTPCRDTLSMPGIDTSSTARDRVHLPLTSEALTMYHRLLARLYP